MFKGKRKEKGKITASLDSGRNRAIKAPKSMRD